MWNAAQGTYTRRVETRLRLLGEIETYWLSVFPLDFISTIFPSEVPNAYLDRESELWNFSKSAMWNKTPKQDRFSIVGCEKRTDKIGQLPSPLRLFTILIWPQSRSSWSRNLESESQTSNPNRKYKEDASTGLQGKSPFVIRIVLWNAFRLRFIVVLNFTTIVHLLVRVIRLL